MNKLEALGVCKQNIYTDTISGIKSARPQLTALTETLKPGDILMVTKLDRLMRSLSKGIDLINNLIERNITIISIDDNITFDNAPMNKAMRQIILVFAELERDLIRQRTQEGKSLAKTKPGFTEGRPKKFTQHQIQEAVNLLKTHSYKEVEAKTQISKSTLQRAKCASKQKSCCRNP
jgi:DNA invertase Pin-like site-specific DNA recombinase